MVRSTPHKFVLVAVAVAVVLASASAQSVQIAKWRNDATGAYSIVMDDYGGGDLGMRRYADSMYVNRGVAVSLAVIAGNVDPLNWFYGRTYFAHGHEFVSHSWSHKDPWGPADFAIEIDSSKAEIERQMPGNRCLFFGFPFEIFTDAMVNYIRTREYIGCRAGNFHGYVVNSGTSFDPFRTKFKGYGSTDGTATLNAYVNDAITDSGWALRETHQINPSIGYNPVHPDTLVAHLDYCRSRINNGELWMAPVQHVILYAMEREHYSVNIATQTSTELTIEFTTDAARIHPSPSIANTLYDYPLTLILTPPLNFTVVSVMQNGQPLPFVHVGQTVRFDALPYAGTVTVSSDVSAAHFRTSLRRSPRATLERREADLFDLRGTRAHSPSALCSGVYVVRGRTAPSPRTILTRIR